MTNKQEKQELKSCPVPAALAPVRQLKKGEQVSALIFEGGGTKGAAYAGVVKALDAAGLVKDVTAMEARGREAVERYLEYDLPAEVSARHANY